MNRQHAFFGLAALGLVLPLSQFLPWLFEHGFDPARMAAELWANGISRFFAMDVFVSAVAVLLFVRVDTRHRSVRGAWVAALGTLTIGVSFGLPLYLWLRERSPRGVLARPGQGDES